MRADIERTIMHFYPSQRLESPLQANVSWDYDRKYEQLKRLIGDLRDLDPSLRPGTGSQYIVSEELVLFDIFLVQLSYLGAYAAIKVAREVEGDDTLQQQQRAIVGLLGQHGYHVMNSEELMAPVPWIRSTRATAWHCLFRLSEA